MELDKIDISLLRELQRDNRLTSDQLSAAVNLSPTAVQRRLKRLRSEGVIERDVAIVSPKAVGRPITMIVMVTLERERSTIISRFKEAIRDAPEIMSGYYVTGESDFILVITSRSMDDYEAFTTRFFYENPDIKGFKTHVVMDRVKSGFELPLDEL
ncbi:Lrp/AsnC family transcriptional regulator [Pelagovum pacificum]|uniref:Lrp/AsnC family transcriptional regulator n=1 Tax=Pelagovum pacificum TaxID=2588711 RepID=A0A5C5GB63_9RHOB|nr:Lrp/AsnC family transcriptional regulator [Pelagovum pacificum]QQA42221.1 Lrp/AsnC family transcriptional regulator [Pelagovum pacificum]TNY31307.1 Lrp/AsnC family transcriptional regulator [Pelagovum pacificum]